MVQVPSGWTTSGIDWTSASTIRNSRTEDVIRELYLATSERDFWVRRWSLATTSSYIPSSGRLRVEDQMKFIMDTLSNWLTTDLNPIQNDGFVENQAVWIDESQIPIGLDLSNSSSWDFKTRTDNITSTGAVIDLTSNQINMQIPHYNMSINGNLEVSIGRDLSFLRSYPINKRINVSDLFSIYLILSFLTKARAYQVYKSGSVYQHYLLNNGVENILRYYSGSFNLDTDTAYDNWVNDIPNSVSNTQYKYTGYSQETDYRLTGTRYRITSHEHTFEISNMVGYDSQVYNASDFEFNMLFSQFVNGWGQNPTLGLVNGINEMGDKRDGNGAKAFSFPNTSMQTFPPILTNFEDSVWETIGKIMPYANMNKEGFLKYYTEEAN